MSNRDKWIVEVAKTLNAVSDLIDVCDNYSEMDTTPQRWYLALLQRMQEDAVRLREAMSSIPLSRQPAGS